MKTFYQLSATSLANKEIPMSNYKGQVILVVNTASKCGFTPQYEGLESLYKRYKDQGFTILGFPCNQFLFQEPGDASKIKNECLINYGVSFPMFSKIKVNGPNTHPIYNFLKSKQKGTMGGFISWNFTKFLIDRNGDVIARFSPKTKPEAIETFIQKLL